MKVNSSSDKVIDLTPAESEWLRENYPANYTNLQRMIRDGKARIVNEVSG